MKIPRFFSKIYIFKECVEYNVGFWECPGFIFLILGLINIVAMISTYFIANHFTDQPEIVALIVIGVTVIFLVISHTVSNGFDKLAQANKMKTEFVSIASHQLRTPLSAMRWTLNLLNDSDFKAKDYNTQEKFEYLTLIQESNERMIRLVNDLLDVSRIEMGRIILNPKSTDVRPIVNKIIENFAALARAHNVDLKFEADQDLPNIFVDPEKISLVIQNLIDNGIKYVKKKGEVKVQATKMGDRVAISITDNGVGIPDAQQKHIFQKFFRSDNVMKHQTEGTGLGLFIAKALVEESGGKIWFKSKENQGTTFFILLPVFK